LQENEQFPLSTQGNVPLVTLVFVPLKIGPTGELVGSSSGGQAAQQFIQDGGPTRQEEDVIAAAARNVNASNLIFL